MAQRWGADVQYSQRFGVLDSRPQRHNPLTIARTCRVQPLCPKFDGTLDPFHRWIDGIRKARKSNAEVSVYMTFLYNVTLFSLHTLFVQRVLFSWLSFWHRFGLGLGVPGSTAPSQSPSAAMLLRISSLLRCFRTTANLHCCVQMSQLIVGTLWQTGTTITKFIAVSLIVVNRHMCRMNWRKNSN